jgi:4-aminobutyrate aminotransferase-like enzyme
VITRRAIANALASQGSFFSSSGGSTLSSRIGVAVLDVLEGEGLQANAREVGGYLRAELEALAARRPLIGAVHGRGLYLGVEFVRDRATLEPAATETAAICARLLELGVIVQPTGDRQNILKVKPPLCFTRDSARFFVEALEEVLSHGW